MHGAGARDFCPLLELQPLASDGPRVSLWWNASSLLDPEPLPIVMPVLEGPVSSPYFPVSFPTPWRGLPAVNSPKKPLFLEF